MKTKFKRFQPETGARVRHKGKSDRQHPYMKVEFWMNPLNQFWNTGMYTENAKAYFNSSLVEKLNLYNKSHVSSS
jgi:hypothetical protein